MSNADTDPRQHLMRLFDAAVKAVHPAHVVALHLPEKPKGRCVIIGAGKASAAMAEAVEAEWPDVAISGVVATRYGHNADCRRVRIIESGHPVPDDNSLLAAKAIIAAMAGLGNDDLVLALISGGGSANIALPMDGLSLAEKRGITKQLLHSGASIEDMNCVRRHVSQVKGGGLLRHIGGAQLVTLVISDVPGDNPASVASGPTIASQHNARHALDIVDRYGLTLSPQIREAMLTQNPPVTASTTAPIVIASAQMALEAAVQLAARLGYNVLNLGGHLECEAREWGKAMAGITQSVQTSARPIPTPAIVLSGGETCVTIGNDRAGRGGRNTEFALSLAHSLNGAAGVWAIAADTDGLDGTEDAAGAIITPDILTRANALGLNAGQFLRDHDSYSFFEPLGDLLFTGPTRTNVNDFRAVLIAQTQESLR